MMNQWISSTGEYAQGDAGQIPDNLVQRSVLGDIQKDDVRDTERMSQGDPMTRLNHSQ